MNSERSILGNGNANNITPSSVGETDFNVPGMYDVLVLTLLLVVPTLTINRCMIMVVHGVQRKKNNLLQTVFVRAAAGQRGISDGRFGGSRSGARGPRTLRELPHTEKGCHGGLLLGSPPGSSLQAHALGQRSGEFHIIISILSSA